MYSRVLKHYSGFSSPFGSRALVLNAHQKSPPGLVTFAKNIESGTAVGVYSTKEILHHPDFDIQIKVRGGEVVQVSHSVVSKELYRCEDPPDDYLEMLSSKFPYSEMLPKVHPR